MFLIGTLIQMEDTYFVTRSVSNCNKKEHCTQQRKEVWKMFGCCQHSANTVPFISHAFEKIKKINIQCPTPGSIKKCISNKWRSGVVTA